MIDDIELLRLIENNARLSSAEIATMLGSSEDEVNSEIDRLKDDNIILGYNTVINWEKKAPDNCIGMIEVRIAPVKNKGYDHIAQILSKYDNTDCHIEESAVCTQVVDGDTIYLDNGKKIRFVGVNTPETSLRNTRLTDLSTTVRIPMTDRQ